ncbi:hypothetical protein BCR44DRAFT_1443566, partial [Catenaria anguillulae PL171]
AHVAFAIISHRLLTCETWNPYTFLGLDATLSPLTATRRDMQQVKRAYRSHMLELRVDRPEGRSRAHIQEAASQIARAYHVVSQSIKSPQSVKGMWVHFAFRDISFAFARVCDHLGLLAAAAGVGLVVPVVFACWSQMHGRQANTERPGN